MKKQNNASTLTINGTGKRAWRLIRAPLPAIHAAACFITHQAQFI